MGLNSAWGKLKRKSDGTEIGRLSLASHCADVAAVAEALLTQSAIAARLAHLARVDKLSEPIVRALVRAVFLHDLGKCNWGFQAKAYSEEVRKAKHIWVAGHIREIAPLFWQDSKLWQEVINAAPALKPYLTEGTSERLLLLAAASHHGDPLVENTLQESKYRDRKDLWVSRHGYDPIAALAELAEALDRWFPQEPGADLDFIYDEPAFVHGFAGLVSLADWIASNPADGFFPYEGDGAERGEFAKRRAVSVLREMRIDAAEARADLLRRAPGFTEVFPFAPSEMQQKMAAADLGPIVVVEAETGSGKTEAALWRFATLFAQGAVDSLVFALPTRIAATQIAGRVDRFIKALFPNRDLRPNTVLAVPGYVRADGEDAKELLPHFEMLWPDSPDEVAAHRRWAAENPKRYLAAAVAVGTIDQVLLSGIATRHAHLRGAALLRALLVIDEVHASDAYMTALLRGVLQRHVSAGGHAVLLSATLGGAVREELVRAGQGVRLSRSTAEALSAIPYPAVSDKSGAKLVESRGGEKEKQKEKQVKITLAPWLDEPEEIGRTALAAARAGARVLVVRNTVAGTIAVQRAIETAAAADDSVLFRAGGVIAPHHGRFATEDRKRLDAAVEQNFGKGTDPHRGIVLVGTQTLEQSLDIDADLLLTDLAPIDVLLQRLGRLHRHLEWRARPPGFAACRCTVMTPAERDLTAFLRPRRDISRHGLGSVYENLVAIEAAWGLLERQRVLSIPHDNRRLVEEGTDRERLRKLAEGLGPLWKEHWQNDIGKYFSQTQEAAHAALDWFRDWNEVTWPPTLGERARTRLGLDDRLAIFDTPFPSPFGAELRDIKFPAWLLRGLQIGPEDKATVIDSASGITRFAFADGRFSYSRLGLERETS
ncbi:MAG: CRISPR-associated helicase Cas3' [Stellaceae bacterium]